MDNVPRLKRPHPINRKTQIIHLGPGAFFRAFNAIYTSDVTPKDDLNWGIGAVSLKSTTARDSLAPQGYCYTAMSLDEDDFSLQVIDILKFVLVAPENQQAVLDVLSHSDIKIVSLTITEKGYCYNTAIGGLDIHHPDIQHDIHNPSKPKTAIGFIIHALANRRKKAIAPFTVMSCDNMPENGSLTRKIILDFAQIIDPSLASWIEEYGAFPSTMVDRITPATTPENIKILSEYSGYNDKACVVHEPFRQWVIEDNFVNDDRPHWDKAGAQFVADVAPFEMMKLRCLNGTHSALAYLGYLSGFDTIYNTMSDQNFERYIHYLWSNEITPSLPPIHGLDINSYCQQLKQRYLNPSIKHLTSQIAIDGSKKIPQRLLGTVADNIALGRAINGLSLAIAAWIRFVSGINEKGGAIDVKDPMKDQLQKLFMDNTAPENYVSAILQLDSIFPKNLANNDIFRENVIKNYKNLLAIGAHESVKRFHD